VSDDQYHRRRADAAEERRINRLERKVDHLDARMDVLSTRVAIGAAVIGTVTVVANIIGPVIAERILGAIGH
jgi:hypothetical protein